jgi:hypothetical protein
MPTGDQGTFSSPRRAHQADAEAIARRAYELYQQRGCEPGHEIEDWLQAEAELAARADGGNTDGIGSRSDGKPDGQSSSGSTSTSAAPARKGNGSRRSPRQSQSH